MHRKGSGWIKAMLNWLKDPANSHWKLALYWPFYVAGYLLVGRLGGRIPPICTSLPLDYRIPCVPAFIIPYLMWFPFWVGWLVYALVKEPKLFRRTMHYFMVTFSAAVFIFWMFPTSPGLRPARFERENLFTWLMRFAYFMDPDRNACPSEHIVGLFAVIFAIWQSERLKSPWWRIGAVLVASVIAVSTVLVRQHAVVDLLAAVPLSALGGLLCFWLPRRREKRLSPAPKRVDSRGNS